MYRYLILSVLPLLLISCATNGDKVSPALADTRAYFNDEILIYEKTDCENIEMVKRYGSCVVLDKIYSMPSEAIYDKEVKHPDGTHIKTRIDNSGRPDFMESAASTANSLMVKKVFDND